MSQASTELKTEIEKSLNVLRTLRDEVRLKLHLASMDAKDEWTKLEPHLAQVEHAAEAVTEAAHVAVRDAVKQLKDLQSSLI